MLAAPNLQGNVVIVGNINGGIFQDGGDESALVRLKSHLVINDVLCLQLASRHGVWKFVAWEEGVFFHDVEATFD